MWYRIICQKKNKEGKKEEDFSAKLDVYTSMAHYVGKTLNIRPSDILDNWGCAELIVAYGEYANEQSLKQYEEWKTMSAKHRGAQPKKYQVKFIGD